MSCSAYGNALIGCKLDVEDFVKVRTVVKPAAGGCGHNIPVLAKFCPECGKAIPRSSTIVADADTFLKNAGLVCIAGGSSDNTEYYATLPVLLARTSDINCGGDGGFKAEMVIDDLEHLKGVLKSRLEARGLWREENFALWAVGYCSY